MKTAFFFKISGKKFNAVLLTDFLADLINNRRFFMW